MPLMPMPPTPMKWMGPTSRGSFILGSLQSWPAGGKCCHKVGQPFGGIRRTLIQGCCRSLLKGWAILHQPRQKACKISGFQFSLGENPACARTLEILCVAQLVIVDGMGQRHQCCRAADDTQLRHGGCARAAHYEMRG